MGNQREIQQTSPRRCRGVAITIRPEFGERVKNILKSLDGKFYTYFVAAGSPLKFENLDVDETDLGIADAPTMIVQSGGKMYCGYDDFVWHIREMAPFLEDASFLVGDELDYVDEFQLVAGTLLYKRLHFGGWIPLDEFIKSRT